MTTNHAKHKDERAGRDLRMKMLTTPASQLGIAPTADFPAVYGVLMDFPIGEDFATIVSLCDGSASLYTTSTFGIIGGIGHQSVRVDAVGFVKAAAEHTNQAKRVSEYPYPASGCVNFYLLTFDGVLLLSASSSKITEEKHRLMPLYAQGQRVLTRLRETVEQRHGTIPSESRPTEEPAYANTLLTLMSEGQLKTVRLSMSDSLPDLSLLVGNDQRARDWVESQQFDRRSLNPKAVIGLIAASAKLSAVPLLTRRGSLSAIHVTTEKTKVARVFDLLLGPGGRWLVITLAPDNDPRVEKLLSETKGST